MGLDSHHSLVQIVGKKYHLPEKALRQVEVVRKAVDARRKSNICLVYHVKATVDVPTGVLQKLLRDPQVTLWEEKTEPPAVFGTEKLQDRPVVIGLGPAGWWRLWNWPGTGTLLWWWNGAETCPTG